MKKNKICRSIVALLLIAVLFVAEASTAVASKYTYTTPKTTSWTLYKTTTSAYTYNLLKTYRYQTEIKKYTGNSYYTKVYPVSSNYWHTKGEADCVATNAIETTHTFSCTATGEAAGFGGELGYSKSITSSKSVSNTLSTGSAEGYYYFGVKAKLRDFKVEKRKKYWKKVNGVYKSEPTKLTRSTAVRLYSNPLYYKWYKSS